VALHAISVVAGFGHEKGVVAGAAADIVERGMIVGLGTGSTVAYLLRALAARGLDVRCPTTSLATERATRALGMEVESFSGPSAPRCVDLARYGEGGAASCP
jgi:ribose 5-phosphate isomerase